MRPIAIQRGVDEQVGPVLGSQVNQYDQRAFGWESGLGAGFLEFFARTRGQA